MKPLLVQQRPGGLHVIPRSYRCIINMPVREQGRCSASSLIIIPGYASSESSASLRDLSPLVSGTDLIVTITASPTMDQNMSDAALFSPNDSLFGVASNQEQLEYPYGLRKQQMQEIQMILSLEMLLIVEQLFTVRLQVQQRKQQMQVIQRILSSETLLIVEQLLTDLLQVQQRKQQMQEIQRIDYEPEQLNKIFEFEDAAQIDSGPEQLNEIVDIEEAAQSDPE